MWTWFSNFLKNAFVSPVKGESAYHGMDGWRYCVGCSERRTQCAAFTGSSLLSPLPR